MKTTILLTFVLACCFSAFSQSITSLAIIPSSPTPTDDIKLIAVTSYPGGPCSRFSSYPNSQNGNTITVKPIYCFESGSGGCSVTDTIDIGQLSAGNYTISFELLSNTNPGPCGSELFGLKAIQQLSFSVGTATGIANETLSKVTFFPNPVKDVVTFSLTQEQADAVIKIYNATGLLVKALPAGNITREIDFSGLSNGVYLYTISNGEQLLSGKLVVAR